MLKALCDIDGTLVDSDVLHAEAWVRACVSGYLFSLDDVLYQIRALFAARELEIELPRFYFTGMRRLTTS